MVPLDVNKQLNDLRDTMGSGGQLRVMTDPYRGPNTRKQPPTDLVESTHKYAGPTLPAFNLAAFVQFVHDRFREYEQRISDLENLTSQPSGAIQFLDIIP